MIQKIGVIIEHRYDSINFMNKLCAVAPTVEVVVWINFVSGSSEVMKLNRTFSQKELDKY